MKVSIYQNGTKIFEKEVEGNSTTLEELGFYPNFNTHNYLVVNTETQLTSVTSVIHSAELIGVDGVLINVTPKDSKAGASRPELYAQIKDILISRPELKSVVGNYTQKPNSFLEEFVNTYNALPDIDSCVNAIIEMSEQLTDEQKRKIAIALAPHLYLSISEFRK